MNSSAFPAVVRVLMAAASITAMAACSHDTLVAPAPRAELSGCPNLQVPASSQLVARVYATGVQIYQWNDTSWVFVSPSASLSTDAEGREAVGIHYSGPTWQSINGGKVTGAVLERCTATASAIPWLLLRATSDGQPGAFEQATLIQRVNTAGGTAPTARGTTVGQVVSVPYKAEYFFYRG